NVTAGAAIQANFNAMVGTNHITRSVKDAGNNPIVGVQGSAYSSVGQGFQSQQNTGSHSNFSLNVGNGNWNVSVYCCCDNNSLQSIGNYQCPSGTNINIANNNGLANFVVQTNGGGGGGSQIGGYVTNNVGTPITGLGVNANDGVG